jgi:hypothetical protein
MDFSQGNQCPRWPMSPEEEYGFRVGGAYGRAQAIAELMSRVDFRKPRDLYKWLEKETEKAWRAFHRERTAAARKLGAQRLCKCSGSEHMIGDVPKCEYYKHHCDLCHKRRLCTKDGCQGVWMRDALSRRLEAIRKPPTGAPIEG